MAEYSRRENRVRMTWNCHLLVSDLSQTYAMNSVEIDTVLKNNNIK